MKLAKNDDQSSLFESSLMTSSSQPLDMFEGSPNNMQNGAQKKRRIGKHNKIAFNDMKMLEQIHNIH